MRLIIKQFVPLLEVLLLGVTVIQSLISGVGLMITDIPGADIWAIAVLILAIAQLPPILILGPITAYYFSVADTTPAIVFLIFSIIMSASDAFLRLLFLRSRHKYPYNRYFTWCYWWHAAFRYYRFIFWRCGIRLRINDGWVKSYSIK
tara:strand:- start:294 stop:737 length:444 start_codon:yes stop_codon:yes gene_type:complete